jgi:hypothetical protein
VGEEQTADKNPCNKQLLLPPAFKQRTEQSDPMELKPTWKK